MITNAIGSKAEALHAYQQARDLRERLVRDHSPVVAYRQELARTYNNLGILHADTGQSAEALHAYQQARDLQDSLVRDHPTVVAYRQDLARTYNNLGTLYADTGQPAEALHAYQQARDLQDSLMHDHPTVIAYRQELARTYNNLGTLYADTGQPAEALHAYQQACDLRERLVREHPTVVAYHRELAASYFVIGHIQEELDDLKGARDAFEKRLLIILSFADGRADRQLQRELAIAYGTLAWVELLNRQPQKAIDLSTRGLEIDQTQAWITTNLAHGYLFDHQYENARVIYLENKDVQINDRQTFADAVLDDFLKFRQKGVTHPDMEKIEQLLRSSARSTER